MWANPEQAGQGGRLNPSRSTLPILQWKTTVSRVLGVEGYSTYFYILAFFKAKWLTAHGTRQLQIFQVAYARFPDKA